MNCLIENLLNLIEGEQVSRVECVMLGTAAERFRSIGRNELADLYRFATNFR